MEIEAPRVAKSALPGQFIIIKNTEKGERVPLTIADYDAEKGTVTIVTQAIGKSTMELMSYNEGDYVCDFVAHLVCLVNSVLCQKKNLKNRRLFS